jgi:hypothetical protein
MTGGGQFSRRSVLRAALAIGSAAGLGGTVAGCNTGPTGTVLSDGVLERGYA